ncbi:MAG: TraR/DksA family transcriptional regulator [Luteolibacter sp.]
MDTDLEIELEIRMREEIEHLLADIEAGKEGTAPPESLDGTIGRLSRQDSLMQQELAKDAQRRRTLKLHLLQQALARMDEGKYGSCLQCGDAIPDERLRETPEAPLCAACSGG